jgi:hypothetical protein
MARTGVSASATISCRHKIVNAATYLSTPLANDLSPYNLICGLLGEGLVLLWLLVIGLNAQKWKELTTAQGVSSP